ncbi:sigma factor binding protein 1, chloroplastic [Cocos nucifera]|uniref:Sigma factor binding protein 1, chloroplastic n=1 Tax=Cocos nucifera TaxID=13894 RepID=A0A8K0IRG8_COCNU|nr:sigma factor binding protein 1, chloroplastic [Cocos nucifera]
MERLSLHQKNTKQAKAKKKPIKVVYISNPMKIKTSAAEFRNLVQELTGQDSNVATLSKSPYVEDTGDPPPLPEPSSGATGTPGPNPVMNQGSDPCHNAFRNLSSPYEMIDEAFDLQMLENIPGFWPSPLYHEP